MQLVVVKCLPPSTSVQAFVVVLQYEVGEEQWVLEVHSTHLFVEGLQAVFGATQLVSDEQGGLQAAVCFRNSSA